MKTQVAITLLAVLVIFLFCYIYYLPTQEKAVSHDYRGVVREAKPDIGEYEFKDETIKVGDIYDWKNVDEQKNPFYKGKPVVYEILEIKDGWINGVAYQPANKELSKRDVPMMITDFKSAEKKGYFTKKTQGELK